MFAAERPARPRRQRRTLPFRVTLSALACLGIGLAPTEAAAQCVDGTTEIIALSAGIGAGVGSAAALSTAGLLETLDDSRDFSFGIGLAAGTGVSVGLAGVYALVDGSSGCSMANDANPIVWSVPIVTFILGAALPVAVWGASDEIGAEEETDETEQALGSARGPALMLRHSWTF